jgi:ferrochelatase
MGVSAAPGASSEPASRRTAVLLVNLGTPDSPSVPDVRRYLREFLSDPRVLDMNPMGRALLLHGVILRTRPARSAAAYAKIWTDAGSPLLVESQKLRDRVASELGDGFRVALAMRYGRPSIEQTIHELLAGGPAQLVIVPLFPQYSTAATGSALARVFEVLAEAETGQLLEVHTTAPFYDDPGWLAAWADVGREPLQAFEPGHVLFSYHGLPERQILPLDTSGQHCLASESCCDSIGTANRACYRAQCFATSRGLAESLELDATPWSVSFQSRLGRTPWIRPFTDEVLPELAAGGVRRLALLCPAFVADCLETLEEIDIRLRQQWHDLGGEDMLLVQCPNAHPAWARTVASWIRREAKTR